MSQKQVTTFNNQHITCYKLPPLWAKTVGALGLIEKATFQPYHKLCQKQLRDKFSNMVGSQETRNCHSASEK